MFNKIKKTLTIACITAAMLSTAQASKQVRIVGSSTVYPFSTVVAEEFGKKTKNKTPIVESTGTGGGFKLFCSGTGKNTPDITNASRRIKPREYVNCLKAGVKDIIEVKFGYDGIVVANAKGGAKFDLSIKDLFLGLAAKVPSKDNPKELVDNYYTTWKDVNPNLPDQKIQVFGPPPTSGTRDAFAELVMEAGCWFDDAYKTKYPNPKQRKAACHRMREDGAYVDAGENDNLIIQKLRTNENALGIFGYSFLEQNTATIQGASILGVEPDYDNIADGKYVISRPLYFYVKKAHFDKTKGLQDFVLEFVSEDAIGEDGYLGYRGLISLPDDLRLVVQQDVINGNVLENLAEEEEISSKEL